MLTCTPQAWPELRQASQHGATLKFLSVASSLRQGMYVCIIKPMRTELLLVQVSLLYRTETQHIMPASSGTSKYNLQVADILPSIGIIHDMVTGKL